MTNLTVISHSCVLPENQRLWAEVARQPEVQLTLIAPLRWQAALQGPLQFSALPELQQQARPLRIHWPGQPHLHVYRGLKAQLTALRPDVVYLDEDPHSLVAAQVLPLQAALGFRLVITLKQNILKHYPPPFSWVEQRTYRLACCAAATSTECVQVAQAKGFRRPAEVIGYPIDTTAFHPHGKVPEPERVRVGFAGRLVPEKGVADLIDALAMAQRQAAFRLSVIGDGPEGPRLQEQAQRQLQPNSWGFFDHLPAEEMPEWYRTLDVLVLPSLTTAHWKEQFGRVLGEAMACSVPVIGSSSGFIPEFIDSTGGGVVYPEGDVPALADALVTLAADPALRQRLGQQGRAGIEREYSLAAVTAKVMRLIS